MNWLNYCTSFKDKLKSQYLKIMKKTCNLENPKTLMEKIQWLKIYDSSFLKTYCADKISIHNYCEDKLGMDICIPILEVYDNPNKIEWNKLPSKFVIKCNHGSAFNIIVKDKNKLNIKNTIDKLNKWLKIDYSTRFYELHYHNIPHKILIEEYKENLGSLDLMDYKFYCFNGEPKFCQVITDRHTNEKISHYDLNWNYSKIYDEYPYNSIPNIQKPKNLELMIEYAKKLSNDFKFVRVDFYEINDTVYLGELTFTPGAGYIKYRNSNIDLTLGEMLKL